MQWPACAHVCAGNVVWEFDKRKYTKESNFRNLPILELPPADYSSLTVRLGLGLGSLLRSGQLKTTVATQVVDKLRFEFAFIAGIVVARQETNLEGAERYARRYARAYEHGGT